MENSYNINFTNKALQSNSQKHYNSPEYTEFTRRMDAVRKRAMECRLVAVNDTSLENLVTLIQKHDWHQNFFFAQPRWTDVVMEALRRGLIDRYAASELLLYWKRNQEEDHLCVVPLFLENGLPNLEAVRIVSKSLEVNNEGKYGRRIANGHKFTNFLSGKQIIEFFKEMSQEDNLQKYLFLSYEESLEEDSAIDYQYLELRCTPLQYFEHSEEKGYARLTPSPKMMEVFTRILCGEESAVRANLVLGPSSWEEFLNIEQHDVQIPSPDEPTPNEVHDYVAIKDDYTKHDLGYHLYIKSCIPLEIRKIYRDISLFIERLEKSSTDPKLNNQLLFLKEAFLNMDVSFFRKEKLSYLLQKNHLPQGWNTLFWSGFMSFIFFAENTLDTQDCEPLIDKKIIQAIISHISIIPPILKEPIIYTPIFEIDAQYENLFDKVSPIWEERLKALP